MEYYLKPGLEEFCLLVPVSFAFLIRVLPPHIWIMYIRGNICGNILTVLFCRS